ncbi:antirestriction protein [Paraburkholderia sp. GAS33]|uniref:antirestriction protein n=1 Tax=Paraburkholderia sp. GAS33 TaxID=3035130 RepID=UPI003D215836
MAPTGREKLHVQCDGNGFNREMSADAMGIVVTLFALCHLAEALEDVTFSTHYLALRSFALGHPESNLIFQAID